MAFWISRDKASMIEGGVLTGARRPFQLSATWPGKVSAIAGTVGSLALRFCPEMPSNLSLPEPWCPITSDGLAEYIWICPPSTSAKAGPPPL